MKPVPYNNEKNALTNCASNKQCLEDNLNYPREVVLLCSVPVSNQQLCEELSPIAELRVAAVY